MLPPKNGLPDYAALALPPPPDGRPCVLVNMVASVDGKVVVEGTERGLGSPADQRLMRQLRANADVVLNGAGTLRASGTSSRIGDAALEEARLARGAPRHPIAAVLTGSGDLPLQRAFFTARDFEAVVYVSAAAPAPARAALRATGRPVVELPAGDEVAAMLHHMRHELSAAVLLVEGGPTLNGALLEAGAIDEFFLTVGALIVGGAGGLTAVAGKQPATLAAALRLELVSAFTNAEASEVYLRYRRRS